MCDKAVETEFQTSEPVQEAPAAAPQVVCDANEKLEILAKAFSELQKEVFDLKDLFVRRLYDDKQKKELIEYLEKSAKNAWIEPFLNDMIILLDRIEMQDDDFARSIQEEICDILERRGFEEIKVGETLDPALNKAVKTVVSEDVDHLTVGSVIRKGYTFGGRVLRPAELLMLRPASKHENQEEAQSYDAVIGE